MSTALPEPVTPELNPALGASPAGPPLRAVHSGAGWGLRVDGVPPNLCAESLLHDLGM